MTTTPPPGWYPDPAGSTQQRWWNGTSWSDSMQAPANPYATPSPYGDVQPYAAAAPYQPMQQVNAYGTQPQYAYYGQLSAPAGTNPNTPWMWIIALWPLLGLITAGIYAAMGGLVIDYSGTAPLLTTADIVNYAIGFVLYLAMVAIARFDYQEQMNRQVPRPFHWAFAFIPFPIVYVIGRTVVAYNRTRRGLAPLFVWIGTTVVIFIASFAAGIAIGLSQLPYN